MKQIKKYAIVQEMVEKKEGTDGFYLSLVSFWVQAEPEDGFDTLEEQLAAKNVEEDKQTDDELLNELKPYKKHYREVIELITYSRESTEDEWEHEEAEFIYKIKKRRNKRCQEI